MDKAKIFTSGRSQAVRLPKKYRFKARGVLVNKINDMVILFPRKEGWRLLERGIEHFTEDFLARRAQPDNLQEREPL